MKLGRLGVAGAGVMGSGIAAHWCAHGYDTTLVDISKGKLDNVPPAPRLTKTTELDALATCDLIDRYGMN